ncbi:HET-domain-containing protein [Xylaria arbuscula]|nr:HET-domain-containing protein [Xylaria arbuscula]
MASTSPIYQSLDPTLKCIRVLELLPGVFQSDLRGSLRTVALGDKPSYTALSYTWGGRAEERFLKIRPDAKRMSKSVELPITDNLFRALRRLRRPIKTQVLWVDAVCINQDDIDERSAQVALMEEIYSNASSTAIWLGDISGTSIHDEELTGGQKLVQSASSILRNNPVSDILWNVDCIPMDHAIQTTTPSWKDRGWVIQEYVLSQRPYFQFGSRTRMINKADPWLGHRGFAVPDSGFILEKKIDMFPGLWGLAERLKKLDQIRVEMERGKQMSLYHAALSTSASETTDPRDKVYSLLGFLNPVERKLVYPDYHSSTEVVFSRATYAAFKGPTNFAIFELKKFDTSGGPSTLPTWAYDFKTSDPFSRHIGGQKITEMAVPSLQMNAEYTELKFEAVCCDVVAELTLTTPKFLEECSDHGGHDINTETCVVAKACRKAVELLELAARSFRADEATEILDKIGAENEHQDFLSSLIFSSSRGRALSQEIVVLNLFVNWESITTYLGIPRADYISQYSTETTGPRPIQKSSYLSQSRFYCEEASGSTTVFITTSGNIGIAPSTIKSGDRLVLPLCETASGEIDAKVTPFEKPLALILREQEDDKWTFHGLAHLNGLGNKTQYLQKLKSYIIR